MTAGDVDLLNEKEPICVDNEAIAEEQKPVLVFTREMIFTT